ncbi:hypothetical protein BsWGS_19642 [Bradybaena similaris]
MSNNSLLVAAGRSGHSPDLWAPYLLIGAGCLTFLAAHFWCYHKRNQVRYLRQREEKQLKSGLMERRRVATLILARYQADLGADQSNTDVHLPQTLSDNTNDVSGDQEHNEYSQHSGTNETKEDTLTTRQTAAAAGTTRHSFQQCSDTSVGTTWHSLQHCSNRSASRSAAHPRTWPPADDCQPAESSVSTRYPGSIQPMHSSCLEDTSTRYPRSIQPLHSSNLGESSTSGITNPGYSRTVSACQSSLNVCSHQRAAGSRSALPQEPNSGTSAERRSTSSAAMAAENARVPRHQPGHRPPAPPASRSRVFYTNISSDTRCAGTPFFRSKFPKRRYDGSCVGESGAPSSEQHSASLAFKQWRPSKAQQVENVFLTSFYNYGGGAASDNHGYTSSCSQEAQPRTTFASRDRHKFFSEHPRRNAANTGQSTHALSAVYQKDREPAQGFGRAPNTGRLPGSSSGYQHPFPLHRDTDTDRFPLHRDTDTDRFPLHRDTDTDPFPLHRDTDTDRFPLHRDTDTDRFPLHRDTDTDRFPLHRDTDTDRLPLHRDTDTDPLPLHRDTDTDRFPLHRDTDTDRFPLHRDTDTDRFPLHRDTDTDRFPLHRDTDTDRFPLHRDTDTDRFPLHRDTDTDRFPLHRDTDTDRFPLHRDTDTDRFPLHRDTDTDRFPLHRDTDTDRFPLHRDTDTDRFPLHRDTDTGRFPLHRDTDTDPLPLHRDTDTDRFPLHRDTDTDRFPLHRDTDTDPGARPEPDVTNSQSATDRDNLSRRDLAVRPETASVTFGKRSSPEDTHEPRQVYGADSRGGDDPETCSPYIAKSFPTYDLDVKAEVRSEARLFQQPNLPSICETVPFHLHAPPNSGDRSGVAPFTHAPQVPGNVMGGTSRTAPRLRVLDPNVMCKYSHKLYETTLPD